MNFKALDIVKIPTAPKHEHLVSTFVQNFLNQRRIPFKTDRHGNMIATIKGARRGKSIAFSAHLDHPGFEIVSVQKREIMANFLGGVPLDYFKKGVPVEFFNPAGETTGFGIVRKVVEWKPPIKRVLLARTRGEVSERSFAMWKLPVYSGKIQGTHLVNRVCDDLAGCSAILSMLENIVRMKSRFSGTVHGVFTLREETGLEGAYEVAKAKFLPKSVPVISIETSKALSNAPQGAGPIVRVGDRSSIFDPGLTKLMCQVGTGLRGKDKKFQFQRKLMDGGTCEATAFMEKGYVASGMCVALGNYHNCNPNGKIAAENVDWNDWRGLVRLMTEVAVNQ